MGYFPNGTSGEMYESTFCTNCAHQKPNDGGCAVWMLHLVYNYDQFKDEKVANILDALIPRTADKLGNEECKMFARKGDRCPETGDMFGV